MSTTSKLTINTYVSICSFLTIGEVQKITDSTKQLLPFALIVLGAYGLQVKKSTEKVAKNLRVVFFDIKNPMNNKGNSKPLKWILEYVNIYFVSAFIHKPHGWQLSKQLSPNLGQKYELVQKIKQKLVGGKVESSSSRVLKMFINSLTNNKQIEEAFIVAHNTCCS